MTRAAPPTVKVVVAGDGNVGKTSLIRRWAEGKFESSRVMTIGVDFQTKIVELPEGAVKLSLWDVAGQERFESLRPGFYRGSRAVALVYDVGDKASFVNLARWQAEIRKAVAQARFLVVGNKIDLARVIASAAGQQLAQALGAPYLETSAATGEGVPQMFEALARLAR
jgi:small GTP-binding protein